MFYHTFLNLDLLPSDSFTPTLHLVAYSVNQKGRSEPTVLEDIAINEAEKRTGKIRFYTIAEKSLLDNDPFLFGNVLTDILCFFHATYKRFHFISHTSSCLLHLDVAT